MIKYFWIITRLFGYPGISTPINQPFRYTWLWFTFLFACELMGEHPYIKHILVNLPRLPENQAVRWIKMEYVFYVKIKSSPELGGGQFLYRTSSWWVIRWLTSSIPTSETPYPTLWANHGLATTRLQQLPMGKPILGLHCGMERTHLPKWRLHQDKVKGTLSLFVAKTQHVDLWFGHGRQADKLESFQPLH